MSSAAPLGVDMSSLIGTPDPGGIFLCIRRAIQCWGAMSSSWGLEPPSCRIAQQRVVDRLSSRGVHSDVLDRVWVVVDPHREVQVSVVHELVEALHGAGCAQNNVLF